MDPVEPKYAYIVSAVAVVILLLFGVIHIYFMASSGRVVYRGEGSITKKNFVSSHVSDGIFFPNEWSVEVSIEDEGHASMTMDLDTYNGLDIGDLVGLTYIKSRWSDKLMAMRMDFSRHGGSE